VEESASSPSTAIGQRGVKKGIRLLSGGGNVRGFVPNDMKIEIAKADDHDQLRALFCSAYLKYVSIIGKEPEPMTRGFNEIRLFTNEKMWETIAIYTKYGYKETGRKEENGFKRVYFTKTLAQPG
jgi:hypothetical protein